MSLSHTIDVHAPIARPSSVRASVVIALVIASFAAGLLTGDRVDLPADPRSNAVQASLSGIEDWHGNVRRSHWR